MNQEVLDLWRRALRAMQTAGDWADQDPDAAASRAYYAAYYAVSAWFAFQERTFRKHSALEAAVHRDLVKSGMWPKQMGAAYSWLASLRQTGDYGGETHVTTQEAQVAVTAAGEILQTVRDTFPEALPDETP